MSHPLRAAAIRAAAASPYIWAAIYTAIVMAHGIPALRQDWSWPIESSSFASLWTTSVSGWDPRGIGMPNLHLNDYLVGGILSLIGLGLGPYAALAVLIFGVGLACALAASSLARALGADWAACSAAGLIGLFNPWTYAETIAGHTYMLLAFGALIALVAELMRDRPRPISASLLVALTLVQLQFFLPALALAAYAALRGRAGLPFVTGLVAGAPVFAGIAAEYAAFRSVPSTHVWEISQSTAPASAALLSGYFAGYGQHFDLFAAWPMRLIIAVALLGVASSWRTTAAKAAAFVGVISIAFASGLRGPFGAALDWVFATVPAAGLYRELFDVLGFLVIAYVAAVSLAAARSRVASALLFACGAALALGWIAWSPWLWWVPGQTIPIPIIDAAPGSRFALLPAFQPFVYNGKGSGLDPDAYLRDGAAPLNVQTPQYPIDAALERYALYRDSTSLSALGVSTIVVRPWLLTDDATRAYQVALPQVPSLRATSAQLHPAPRLSLIRMPLPITSGGVIGAGAVFFADAAGIRGAQIPKTWSTFRPLIAVRAPMLYADAAKGWVDARLTFAENPGLAQAFGGAATTSRTDVLSVAPGVPALAFVQGRLTSRDGRTLSGSTSGYSWLTIPRDVTAVRCFGLCAIAAQGYPPANIPDSTPPAPAVAVAYRTWAPWLISAELSRGNASALRLNDAFDSNWIAAAAGAYLTHVRLDTTVNAWIVPARPETVTVWLVEWAAALQALLEAVAVISLFSLGLSAARQIKRPLWQPRR